MGSRGAGSGRSGNKTQVSYERSSTFDYQLFSKLPKKLQVENIIDIGKESTFDGNRYHAVIKFDDGFTRSIGAYNQKEFKDYIDAILNEDRNIEY